MASPLLDFIAALKLELQQYPVRGVTFERGATDADWSVVCCADDVEQGEKLKTWNHERRTMPLDSTVEVGLTLWDWWMAHALPLMRSDAQARTFILDQIEGHMLGTRGHGIEMPDGDPAA